MEKRDLKKELKHLYSTSVKKPIMVDVPAMHILMIDGSGDPNTSEDFQDAVNVLYSVSYTLKFAVKKGGPGIDYGVMPLEGLWWSEDMSQFSPDKKEDWLWTLMIMQPDFITREMIDEAIEATSQKKELSSLGHLRFEQYHEGFAAQIMHKGPFSEEEATIRHLHQFIDEQDYQRSGKHHEIYLSDIRRAKPENWRTILRQPVQR